MAYNGTTRLASGITQLNGQDYALVDASAVRVDDSTRLDAALEGITNTINEELMIRSTSAEVAALTYVSNSDTPRYFGITKTNLLPLLNITVDGVTRNFPFTLGATNWLVYIDTYAGSQKKVDLISSTGVEHYVGITAASHSSYCNWYDVGRSAAYSYTDSAIAPISSDLTAATGDIADLEVLTAGMLQRASSAEVAALTYVTDIAIPRYFGITKTNLLPLLNITIDGVDHNFPYTLTATNWMVYVDIYSGSAKKVDIISSTGTEHYVGITAASHSSYCNWYDVGYTTATTYTDNAVNPLMRKLTSAEISSLTYVTNSATPRYFGSTKTDLAPLLDITVDGVARNFPFTLGAINWLVYIDTYAGSQKKVDLISSTGVEHYVGITAASHSSYCNWYDVSQNHFKNLNTVRVLAFGNSYTYSTLGYLPQVMKELLPDVMFQIGICYNSGESSSGHISAWNNGTPYEAYSFYDSETGVWTNSSSSVTGKTAVRSRDWDVIVLQESVSLLDNSQLDTFAELIMAYANKSFVFAYNIPQTSNRNRPAEDWLPKYRNIADPWERQIAQFTDIVDFAEDQLNGPYISFVFPGGTAVQNARTTDLVQLGAEGDMANDLTGHLENGIGPLIGAYAAAYKLSEFFGYRPQLFAQTYNPTDSDLNTINYYCRTSHGTCVGVTAENKLLVQKCVLAALKNPFDYTDFSQS